MSVDLKYRVEMVIDSMRPFLEADGGDVIVVDITHNGTVLVKFIGACDQCKMRSGTLKAGLEVEIMRVVPEIKAVEAINS